MYLLTVRFRSVGVVIYKKHEDDLAASSYFFDGAE